MAFALDRSWCDDASEPDFTDPIEVGTGEVAFAIAQPGEGDAATTQAGLRAAAVVAEITRSVEAFVAGLCAERAPTDRSNR